MEDRAMYQSGARKRPVTFRDLRTWLDRFQPDQLDAPVLVTAGADDFGDTEYLGVGELVSVASECARISGGYEGPVLVVQAIGRQT